MNIFVYGAGGHGKVILDTIREGRPLYHVSRLIDDNVGLHGGTLFGLPIQGADAIDLEPGFIAIGDNAARLRVAARYRGRLVTLAHRSAILGGDVRLGEGTVL